jgi:hypothetical protein
LINENTSPREARELVIHVKNDCRAIPYIVEPLQEDIQLSSLSLLYTVAFSMGMLVRYHPSRWADVSKYGSHDSVFPILSAASDLIQQKYPLLVLQEIEQNHPGSISYCHPSFS